MKRSRLICLLVFITAWTASAQDRIQITKQGSADIGLEFSRFSADSGPGADFFSGLRRNLTLHSRLREVPPSQAGFHVAGRAVVSGDQLDVTVELVGRGSNQRRFGKRYRSPAGAAAQLARQVSDDLTESLTGERGFAGRRILFVGRRAGGDGRDIYSMYPDGGGVVQLTRDNSVVLAPQWAPDGERFTYTSFRRGFPDLYLQTLQPPGREIISSASGMNSGGAISPDGRRVALVLSKDGRPEIYAMDLRSRRTTRLTRTPMSAKSSPRWSPDGRELVFVSGHQGPANLFVLGMDGGEPRRITRGGGESVSPDWGSNGLIALTRRRSGRFAIAVLNPRTGEQQFISPEDGADYEDPSWAADGIHLVASRTVRGQSSLVLLDIHGKASQTLLQGQGNWYMPSFRP